MSINNLEEYNGIKRIGYIVGYTLRQMINSLRAGMSTYELDQIGYEILRSFGANPAPNKAYGFPGATCISLDNEVAHGIPRADRFIEAGMLVNIDVSAELNGFYADNGATIPFGITDPRILQLCKTSKEALKQAIERAKPNVRVNRIGQSISKVAQQNGFKVIKDLCGHGVGRAIHEAPREIPNYYDRMNRTKLKRNQVVAIETFVSTGAELTQTAKDGWTQYTTDGSLVAQYEHTVIVTDKEPIIVTASNGIF